MKLIEKVKRCKTKIKEEDQMKTQVFKNSETTAISNLLVLAAMIIFSGILLFANNYRQSLLKNRSFNEHSKPANETFYLNSTITEKAVSGKD